MVAVDIQPDITTEVVAPIIGKQYAGNASEMYFEVVNKYTNHTAYGTLVIRDGEGAEVQNALSEMFTLPTKPVQLKQNENLPGVFGYRTLDSISNDRRLGMVTSSYYIRLTEVGNIPTSTAQPPAAPVLQSTSMKIGRARLKAEMTNKISIAENNAKNYSYGLHQHTIKHVSTNFQDKINKIDMNVQNKFHQYDGKIVQQNYQLNKHNTKLLQQDAQLKQHDKQIKQNKLDIASTEKRLDKKITNAQKISSTQNEVLEARIAELSSELIETTKKLNETETRIKEELETINKNIENTDQTAAINMAMSGLSYLSVPGKISGAVGLGYINQKMAVAVGASYTSSKSTWKANIGVAKSKDKVGVAVGASFVF